MPDFKAGSFAVTGLSDLEKRLAELPDKLAKNVLSGAIRAGAVVVQKEARMLAPVSVKAHKLYSRRTDKMKMDGTHYTVHLIQPGSLRRGIKVRRAPRKYATSPIEYWVYVSKRIWYWKFLEFGTAKMSRKSFLRPAFDTHKEKATVAVREYLAKRIDKELLK